MQTFDAHKTTKQDFYNLGQNVAQVDTMTKTGNYLYADNTDLNAQILELFYRGNDMSMVIMLPNERVGLRALRDKLNVDQFYAAMGGLEKSRVQIFLPKFRVEKSYDLMRDIAPKPLAL